MNLQFGRALALAALVWAGGAQAAEGVPTAKTGLEQVQAQKRVAYEVVLAQFDRAIAATPDDAAIGVGRCEYIDNFTDEESGDYIDGAYEDFEACGTWLRKRWPTAPTVQVFTLEQTWDGEEAVALGAKLGKAIDAWPTPLRARAYAHLAWAYEDIDAGKSGEFAVRAAEIGHAESVDEAIGHLVARHKEDQATRLLDRIEVPTESWVANGILRAALALPDKQAAWRAVQRFEKGGLEDMARAVTATAQLRAGDIPGARKRLGDEPVKGNDSQLAFEILVAARDADAAVAYIDLDGGDFSRTMGRFAVLLDAMPSTLATIPMFSLAFAMVFMLLAVGVACGVILVPAHYRGLARRLRHLPTQSLFAHGSLKGAWYGLAIALVVPMAAMVLASPESVAAMFDGRKAPGMFDAMLWGTVFGLLFLVPATMRMSRRELVGDRATWHAWKRIPLALLVLWTVGFLQAQFHHWTGGGGDTLHTEIVDTVLGEGNAALGGFGALLVVALLGPVMEEIVLRGLLLGGLTRHLSFRWANLLQALVFALMHDDAPRFAFYFALGLLAGWLVKSTRSLGPAIALHVLNNALVVALTMLT
jgi:hypothetical protein